ncbi:hypothetical protein [Limnoglobus roseus]|uniref:Uncharacterized protein n=1 Tax=Limnoglobus roseus TaxID=2598579 RepID=A0A5C1ARQ7_9BACT|nr:hypothetical protein [Limnoglobus roseus]QEL19914.1 hypothetical protein PX52LOC_06996 [Limnoglobus roseus]
MDISCIADLHAVVREHMPNTAEADVEEFAAFLWDEGYARGLRSGDDWGEFVDALPSDMRNYRRPRRRPPASMVFMRRSGSF